MIEVTITAPGYHSTVSIPEDALDKAEAFVDWFKMQLDYLARWTPGSSASLREQKAKFRCIGYDCEAPGAPQPPCGCPDYLEHPLFAAWIAARCA